MSDTLGPLMEGNLLEVFGQRDSARRGVTAWTHSRPISSCDLPALTAHYWMVLIRAGSQGRVSSWMDFDQTPA